MLVGRRTQEKTQEKNEKNLCLQEKVIWFDEMVLACSICMVVSYSGRKLYDMSQEDVVTVSDTQVVMLGKESNSLHTCNDS